MSDKYILNFIKQEDFEEHVKQTIEQYNETLKSIDLKKFNSNYIDPIKLLFDKNVFNKTFDEIIKLEIHRQRDKTNNNVIGYFHQKMFKYIKDCIVPNEGWDVIFYDKNVTYYVEMKNKHNTMNSSSSGKTYMRMQNHLLNADDRNQSICALVEVIAKHSQNIPWSITIDKKKQPANENLRRISMDKFYEIVTGDKYAFKNLCIQLTFTIQKIIEENKALKAEEDTVISELNKSSDDIIIALYKLAFKTYEGFEL